MTIFYLGSTDVDAAVALAAILHDQTKQWSAFDPQVDGGNITLVADVNPDNQTIGGKTPIQLAADFATKFANKDKDMLQQLSLIAPKAWLNIEGAAALEVQLATGMLQQGFAHLQVPLPLKTASVAIAIQFLESMKATITKSKSLTNIATDIVDLQHQPNLTTNQIVHYLRRNRTAWKMKHSDYYRDVLKRMEDTLGFEGESSTSVTHDAAGGSTFLAVSGSDNVEPKDDTVITFPVPDSNKLPHNRGFFQAGPSSASIVIHPGNRSPIPSATVSPLVVDEDTSADLADESVSEESESEETKHRKELSNRLGAYSDKRGNEWGSFHFNFLGIVSFWYYILDGLTGSDHFNSKSREVKIKAAGLLQQHIFGEKVAFSASEISALKEGRLGAIVNEYGGVDALLKSKAIQEEDASIADSRASSSNL